MERGNSKHGSRRDEEMAREVRGLTQGRPGDERSDEWRQAEPAAEDQPEVSLTGGPGPHGEDVDAEPAADRDERARVASYLRRSAFPATGAALVDEARSNQAPDDITAQLSRLSPAEVYANAAEMWAALTGQPIARRPDRP